MSLLWKRNWYFFLHLLTLSIAGQRVSIEIYRISVWSTGNPKYSEKNLWRCHFIHREIHTCASAILSTVKYTPVPVPFYPTWNPHLCQCHFIHHKNPHLCQGHFIHHKIHTSAPPFYPPSNPHLCQGHFIHHTIHICALPFYPPYNPHLCTAVLSTI
jgi:hypothetical protein